MTTPQPPHRAPLVNRSRPVIAAGLLAAALVLGSCASTGTTSMAGATGLERLAQRQINRPANQAASAPAPAGLRLDPIDPIADPNAAASLETALETLTSAEIPMQFLIGVEDDAAVTDEQRDSALRRYIAGRSALVGEDIAEAIKQLDAASQLDPREPQIWRALADAHWRTGDRLAAIASYLRVISLSPDDTVSLLRVGLAERDRRSHDTAAIFLSRAYRSMSPADDAAIPYVVGVALGRTLHELGWMNAGNEAVVGALDEFTTFSQPTTFRRELGAAIRAAGDAWRDTGDANLRLGRPAEALDAYRRAAEFPSFDPAALLTRLVYANMRLGRPAGAAVLLVDRIEELNGLADDRTLDLIQYLSRSSEIGGELAGAIQTAEQGLSPEQRRTAASQLARAKAAALPGAQAVRVLIDRLVIAPSDESAVTDLLGRRAPDDAAGLTALVAELIEANTIESQRYSDALIRYTPDLSALLGAVSEANPDSAGAALLGAALAFESGELDSSRSMLESARTIRPDDPGVIIAQARLAIQTGDLDGARALLTEINPEENQAAALAVARAYRRLGENDRAIEILDQRIWGGEATAEEALVAGEISLATGAPIDAEQLLNLAIELDPTLEDAYAGLISLYQNNGMLASQANLGDTLRALRDAIPSSQTLRWLRVQDLLRADRLDQAQRELLSLAEETLDPVVVEQLVSVWLRTGAAETAQQWLTEQRSVRPNRSVLVRLLARVHAAQKNTTEAIRLLETWLAQRPTDDAASRELENIFRLESVGRQSDADAIALIRLSRSAPSTRRSIELTPILIRQGRVSEAIRTLAEPITESLRIDPSMQQDYAQLVTEVASIAGNNFRDEPEIARQGVEVLRGYLERFPESPVGMHRVLTSLLIQTEADASVIADVAVAAGRAYPQASGDFAVEAIQRLIQIGGDQEAMEVATLAVRQMPGAAPRLLAWTLVLARGQQSEEAAADALALISREQAAVETINALRELFSGSLFEGTPPEQGASMAELAYFVAIAFAGGEQDSASQRFYQLALQHNPRHAMANNNLAFGWVEEGINLERAHEMLIIAYEEDDGSDAIADSLGWVRYKLGMIDDQRDEDGKILFPGAVSMLSAAAKLSMKQEGNDATSAEILDHLADALWRMGQTDRSIEAWRQAMIRLNRQQKILSDLIKERTGESPPQPDPQAAQLEVITTMLERVEAKLDAVAAEEVPPLSPMLRPRRWTQDRPGDDTNNALDPS